VLTIRNVTLLTLPIRPLDITNRPARALNTGTRVLVNQFGLPPLFVYQTTARYIMTSELNKRFLAIFEEDLVSLDNAKDSTSTKRTVSRSVKLFRDFLGPERAKFEVMPKSALNNNLRLFFASIRTVKGDELKKSSLHNIKYGLSKYLKETCKIDISSDSEFSSTVKTFHAKLKDLQKKGKGSVQHKDQITEHDLQRLNDPGNVAFNIETPCGLQNKVRITKNK